MASMTAQDNTHTHTHTYQYMCPLRIVMRCMKQPTCMHTNTHTHNRSPPSRAAHGTYIHTHTLAHTQITCPLRTVMRRLEQPTELDTTTINLSVAVKRPLHMVKKPLDALTWDALMNIFSLLENQELILCMQVNRKWRHLAGLKELWKDRDEACPKEGVVKWSAFRRIRELRHKAHSRVVQCESRKTGQMLVVKRVCTRVNASTGEEHMPAQDQGFPVRYLREISLLRACNHPNIMKLYLISYEDGQLDIFSEFVGQNIEDYIASLPQKYFAKGTTEHARAMTNCKNFMYQILSAVSYCHARGILLRDIKPRNVMLDRNGQGLVKLTGFALGRFASIPAEPLTREVVTLSYRAPEILLGGQSPVYSAPVDMWSVGCTLAEIASGATLFEGESEIGLLFCIFRLLGTPTEQMWPGVTSLPDFLCEPPRWPPKDLSTVAPLFSDGLDLLAKMLQYDPAKRISAKEAMAHPFFHQDSSAEAGTATRSTMQSAYSNKDHHAGSIVSREQARMNSSSHAERVHHQGVGAPVGSNIQASAGGNNQNAMASHGTHASHTSSTYAGTSTSSQGMVASAGSNNQNAVALYHAPASHTLSTYTEAGTSSVSPFPQYMPSTCPGGANVSSISSFSPLLQHSVAVLQHRNFPVLQHNVAVLQTSSCSGPISDAYMPTACPSVHHKAATAVAFPQINTAVHKECSHTQDVSGVMPGQKSLSTAAAAAAAADDWTASSHAQTTSVMPGQMSHSTAEDCFTAPSHPKSSYSCVPPAIRDAQSQQQASQAAGSRQPNSSSTQNQQQQASAAAGPSRPKVNLHLNIHNNNLNVLGNGNARGAPNTHVRGIMEVHALCPHARTPTAAATPYMDVADRMHISDLTPMASQPHVYTSLSWDPMEADEMDYVNLHSQGPRAQQGSSVRPNLSQSQGHNVPARESESESSVYHIDQSRARTQDNSTGTVRPSHARPQDNPTGIDGRSRVRPQDPSTGQELRSEHTLHTDETLHHISESPFDHENSSSSHSHGPIYANQDRHHSSESSFGRHDNSSHGHGPVPVYADHVDQHSSSSHSNEETTSNTAANQLNTSHSNVDQIPSSHSHSDAMSVTGGNHRLTSDVDDLNVSNDHINNIGSMSVSTGQNPSSHSAHTLGTSMHNACPCTAMVQGDNSNNTSVRAWNHGISADAMSVDVSAHSSASVYTSHQQNSTESMHHMGGGYLAVIDNHIMHASQPQNNTVTIHMDALIQLVNRNNAPMILSQPDSASFVYMHDIEESVPNQTQANTHIVHTLQHPNTTHANLVQTNMAQITAHMHSMDADEQHTQLQRLLGVESYFKVFQDDLRGSLLSRDLWFLPSEDYKTNTLLRGFGAMRKILVEWLVEVVEEARMKCETLFLTVNYLDRFLSLQDVAKEKLQLVRYRCLLCVCTCMFVCVCVDRFLSQQDAPEENFIQMVYY
jgi:cyclin-dependent kinase 2